MCEKGLDGMKVFDEPSIKPSLLSFGESWMELLAPRLTDGTLLNLGQWLFQKTPDQRSARTVNFDR